MNHAISGEILVKEVRFPRSEIFLATLVQDLFAFPQGGGQTRICSDQKTYLAKVDRSAQVTIEKWSPFFDFGGPRLVCLSWRGKANKKLLESKNLFSESCSHCLYYYTEVISVFWFGGSKTRLPSPFGGRQTKSCSNQKTYFAKVA